jgi:Fic family protein
MINDYLEKVKQQEYPTKKEWFYKYGKHGNDYAKLLEYKKEKLIKIDLFTTEGSLYFNGEIVQPLMKRYYQIQDLGIESLTHFSETFEDILIFSEVEGTLEIEGVKTSSKKIEETIKKNSVDEKEQVILNMKNGIDYIFTHDIDEENIFELYNILSKESLNEDEKIVNGFYRNSGVDIIGKYGEISDIGVDAKNLNTWMKHFVYFIQKSMLELNQLTYLMPHIIHYYVIYLHPYYDFNGRMARILAYWYIVKCPFIKEKMPVFSEAINYNTQTKAIYYKAIESSREDDNDLTYFIEAMFNLGTRFIDVYIKLNNIEIRSRRIMQVMTKSELNTLKSILLYIKKEEYFTWEDVYAYDKEQYSKQYYLRLLSSLTDKSILTKTQKGKAYHFQINI